MKHRLWAGIFVLVLIFTLAACQPAPVAPTETSLPTETATPAEPQPADLYAQASALFQSTGAITLDVTTATTTSLMGGQFTDHREQVLRYSGLDTDSPMIKLEEEVVYGDTGESTQSAPETEMYSELYANGTLYVALGEIAAFSGQLSAEEAADRYIPPVLLSGELYENLTMAENGGETTFSFADPTAPESWAMPETARFISAAGSAVMSGDGKLQQMQYTITYQYGPAEITKEITAIPRASAELVTVPENADQYVALQCIDALKMTLDGAKQLREAGSVHVTSSEMIISQAAGFTQSQTTTEDLYKESDLKGKVQLNIQALDSYGEETNLTQELLYQNGKLTTTVDDGVPTIQTGLEDGDVQDYFQEIARPIVAGPEFWSDAVLTDLNGVLLLEFTYSDDFGASTQNTLCSLLWQDPAFLNNLASGYKNTELTGYLALDAHTGTVTASGMYYEGVHTIEGQEYRLILGADKAVESPAPGAYREITGKALKEEAPEQTAQPLFYHVTGENGQEMWLLGTIHVGDSRTGFLPQKIYDAFAASDALALEIDEEKFEEQIKDDEQLQAQISDAYYYSDGSTAEEHLNAEAYDRAVQYMKVSGNYSMNAPYMKLSVWENSISNFYLQLGRTLHAEYGVENRLIQLAKEQEKPIREVESTLFQIQMLNGWSEELQQLMLTDILEISAEEYCADVNELYELWCAGDEAALRQAINEEVDPSTLTDEELAEYEQQLPLEEEYDKAMSTDRNAGMLDVAVEYLESGDVVFYAVGLAHLIDDTNGLVEALRQAGYTVELVAYTE